MIDYFSLEKKFKIFRQEIIAYRDFLLDSYGNEIYAAISVIARGQIPRANLKKMEVMRSKLSQKYGSLAGYIHGMAGYVALPFGGTSRDIFMTAFFTFSSNNFHFIHWAIDSSIQCLDKAIGGCQYARSTEIERKGNQIYIHKGAIMAGFREILNILKEAKKSLYIRDRYVSEELVTMIDTLPMNILVKILIKREPYKEKPTLQLFYKKYRQQKNNIEIREIPQSMFHSRQIIIDDQKTYELTFSIKDVGISDGKIFILDNKNMESSKREFNSDWGSGTPI